MTDENRKLLERINNYAESVLGDINPQKTQISVQLERLKPIMETIAKEKNTTVEDIFVLYMDLQSEASVITEQKLKETYEDLNLGDGTKFSFR